MHAPIVTDSGCSMTNAIEALQEFGTCLESKWPYDTSRVNSRPSDEAFQQGRKHRVEQALRVQIDLNEMKACLAQGFPFAFGLRLYTSFDQAAKGGVVPMPNDTEQSRTEHGRFVCLLLEKTTKLIHFFLILLFRHALLAVGYSDQSQAFIVRNSWGANWVSIQFRLLHHSSIS